MTYRVRVSFVAAASADVGLGHDSRTELLALACSEAGMIASRIVVDPAGDLGRLEREWDDSHSPDPHDATDVVVIDGPDTFIDRCLEIIPPQVLRIAFRMYGDRCEASNLDTSIVNQPTREDISITPDPFPSSATVRCGRMIQTGPKYIFVRRSLFAQDDLPKSDPPRVLITFGGADPADLTSFAAEALRPLASSHPIDVVVGRMNPRASELIQRFGTTMNVHRQGDVKFDTLLLDASLAVINGGLTRYECVAARTPFVALSLNKEQARLADGVVATGFGRHAGIAGQVTPGRLLAMAIESLAESEANPSPRNVDQLVAKDAAASFVNELTNWIADRRALDSGQA